MDLLFYVSLLNLYTVLLFGVFASPVSKNFIKPLIFYSLGRVAFCTEKLDLAIVQDVSPTRTLYKEEGFMRTFLSNIIEHSEVESRVRTSMVTFSDQAEVLYMLGDKMDRFDINNTINNITFQV